MKTCQLTCHFIPFFEGSDVSYPFQVFRTLAGTISYLMSTYFIPSCFHTHYDKVSYHLLHSYIHPRTSHIHNFILVALEFHTRTLVHTVNTSHLPSATSYTSCFIQCVSVFIPARCFIQCVSVFIPAQVHTCSYSSSYYHSTSYY